MTTLAKDTRVVTLMNVCTVAPEKQQQRVDRLRQATVVGKEVCMRCVTLAAIVLCVAVTGARSAAAAPPDGPLAEWPSYGGDAGGSRYSPLTQITKANVAALRVAWEYHTGEVSDGVSDCVKM